MTSSEELADFYMVEEEGAAAKLNGEPPWANPYVRSSPFYRMWERGWDRENERRAA